MATAPTTTTTPQDIIGEKDGIQFFVGGTTMPQPQAAPPSTSDLQAMPEIKLPAQTAPNTMQEYFTSMSGTLDSQRKAVEDSYKRQLEDIKRQQDEANKRVAEFTKQQQATLGDVQQATQPFRQDLENSERNRLYINQNFEANQSLVRELETLLTQSSNMMQQLRSSKIPGLAAISQSPRAIQAMQDVSARVGVVQAVMNARTGQIAEGYRMIDRSLDAVNSDRKDQLNYYSTIYDFYQNQKDDEGKKLFQLNQQEESYIKDQIGLLEKDMARSQATADYIKELMINPDTAKFMAESGVTLNDSIEQIQRKMADQTMRQERVKQAEENKKEAFDAGITTPFYNKNGALVRTSDGWGFSSPEEFQKLTGMSVADAEARGLVSNFNMYSVVERQQIEGLMKAFPDAGIRPQDTLEVAEMKLDQSRIYQDKVRPPMGQSGSVSSNNPFKVKDTAASIRTFLNKVKNLAAQSDTPYYDAWGQAADYLESININPSNYDKIFWSVLHPEGDAGYKQQQENSGSGEKLFK